MNSLETMQQRVDGLASKLADLRNQERAFQRVAGLQERQEADRAKWRELQAQADTIKTAIADLKNQKAAAMQETATAIATAMNCMLPFGTAVFEVDDEGGVFLGWDIPEKGIIAHGGLSGGQRVMFEAALSYALMPKGLKNPVILVEGAELGPEIDMLLNRVAETSPDAQIIACTCHNLAAVPAGWSSVAV